MKNQKNTQNGITLIALIITIIVLLILAIVSIKLVWNAEYKEIAKATNEINKQDAIRMLCFFENTSYWTPVRYIEESSDRIIFGAYDHWWVEIDSSNSSGCYELWEIYSDGRVVDTLTSTGSWYGMHNPQGVCPIVKIDATNLEIK